MLFNSTAFAVFLTISFLAYWFVGKNSAIRQNLILLFASVVFYTLTDWKFIFLLFISGFINYNFGILISKKPDESTVRKSIFYTGILFNVGILLYFKYFNFFIASFVSLLNTTGVSDASFTPFHILLPLGISFFTFQMIGYLIDVNNEYVEPCKKPIAFMAYLSYFPKILSGPIVRIQNFIPQIEKARAFDYALAINGMRQILWGLFKKVMIADNITPLVDHVFDFHESLSGSTLVLGAILYAISLYADFSGFSDIACGVSKLFNIKIINNFSYPFFARNIADFWRRWHISLSTWMMDYVHTPLSFILRSLGKKGLLISIFFTFTLVGLWHGAKLTFVVFGVLHGIYFLPLIIKGKTLSNKESDSYSLIDIAKILMLFCLISLTMVFFRANDLNQAFHYFSGIFNSSIFSLPYFGELDFLKVSLSFLAIIIIIFFLFEWFGRSNEFAIEKTLIKRNKYLRWSFYYALAILIMLFNGEQQDFIYLQF